MICEACGVSPAGNCSTLCVTVCFLLDEIRVIKRSLPHTCDEDLFDPRGRCLHCEQDEDDKATKETKS